MAVDERLLRVWEYATGRSRTAVEAYFREMNWRSEEVRAALACLAEGGLLARQGQQPVERQPHSDEISSHGLVSVVLVAYNSREWLDVCLPSLAAQIWRDMEIIVVDNGSRDGVLSWLRETHPEICTLEMPAPTSLATAINAGIRVARGDYFLLLNPDVRLEPDAVQHLVATLKSVPQGAAAVPKLRFLHTPAFLNGIGNRVPWLGFGVDNALGHLDLGQFDHWREVPSACFAATLISRRAWEMVGPLDTAFPLYYEDSEWSYRARALGWKVIAVPEAVVYHAYGGHSTSAGRPVHLSPSKRTFVTYGRLRFAAKIPEQWKRFVAGYALEDTARILQCALRGDFTSVRAIVRGWHWAWRARNEIRAARLEVQSRRYVDDRSLFALQRDMPLARIWRGLPLLTWKHITREYLPLLEAHKTRPVPEFPAQPSRLLIISHDIVDARMAGTGMRYLEMARALSDDNLRVTLAVPGSSSLQDERVAIVPYDRNDQRSVHALASEHDVVLLSAYLAEKFPLLEEISARLVVDLYDPLVLENLHYHQDEPLSIKQAYTRQVVAQTNHLARLGDFFICGNERQRDFWLGVLAANGRVNPQTYAQDSTLRALLDVVGIGFPARPPSRYKPFLRGVHPLVPADARIVLWGGGIWNWLDPLTLVRAWPQVVAQYPRARLVFLGTRHPNPKVPVHEMAQKTVALADEVGEKDRSIVFLEWISYEEREALLLEADVGVALHPVHVETRYSARTRVLDYLWARLPVLITEGDVTSEWVQTYGLGRVVPEGSPDAVAAALMDLLSRPKSAFASAFEPLLTRFTWPRVVAPLRQYCLNGSHAPDRGPRKAVYVARFGILYRLWRLWRVQGTGAMVHRLLRLLRLE